jgi:DNA invertase Pin-like site-specific DNA recombinase
MPAIGYARVSTDEQNLGLQLDALRAAGCERIEQDHGLSGSTTSRPGLDAALAALKPGDALVVWKIDRLGRSLAHLVQTIAELGSRGVGFRSLSDPIDTTNASGRLVLHIMCAMAEFERELIRERTTAGLAAAKRRGQRLGRRASLTPGQAEHARLLVAQGRSHREIGRILGVSHASVQRALARLA